MDAMNSRAFREWKNGMRIQKEYMKQVVRTAEESIKYAESIIRLIERLESSATIMIEETAKAEKGE